MPLINLLPWREKLYLRRRRRFVMMLLLLTAVFVSAGIARYWDGHRDRMVYNSKIKRLQATVVELEQDQLRLQQASEALMEAGKNFRSRIDRRNQLRLWQQWIAEWQQLEAGAHISGINFRGNELLLTGASDSVEPLRNLIHQSPQWQLQQIALDEQARFQFRLARMVQSEGGL